MSKNQTHTKQIARALAARTGMPYTRARKIVVAAMQAGLLPGPFTPEVMPVLVDILCGPVVAALMQPTDALVTDDPPESGEPAVDWSRVVRVKFPETGERWWTVRALHGDFVVVTQQVPFEKKGILRYSVLDLRQGVRGPCNLVGQGWSGIDTDRGCRTLVRAMSLGVVSVSGRNNVLIRPVTIEWAKATPRPEAVAAEPVVPTAVESAAPSPKPLQHEVRPQRSGEGTLVSDGVVTPNGVADAGPGEWSDADRLSAAAALDEAARGEVTTVHVAHVLRRVSVMLDAYMNLPEALSVGASSTNQVPLRDAFVDMAQRCSEQVALADAMAAYPSMFDEFVVAVVRASTTSGGFDLGLKRVAETLAAEAVRVLIARPRARFNRP